MPLRAASGVACCGLGALGLGICGGAMALPIRDFGCFFALTSPPLSRVSSLLAKKACGVGECFDVINGLLKTATA